MRHFLELTDLSPDELRHVLKLAAKMKAARRLGKGSAALRGKIVALLFEKPSLRTRVSFEAAVIQLGGTSLFLPATEVGLGWRESVADVARTMNHYVDAMVLRVFKHQTVVEMARHAIGPVINGLSDERHPCQALADLLTIQEQLGEELAGRTVTFVGDGNNVARSLAIGCGMMAMRFVLSAPNGYGFDGDFEQSFRKAAPRGALEQEPDPMRAVKAADVVYADVWTSMGQEKERDERLRKFAGYQINDELLAAAPRHAKVLHCLPAHRGEEITDEVMDGPRSVVFEQAGNRLHAQKAVLQWLLT